jgi:MYXO-CTERM domain-containing protein
LRRTLLLSALLAAAAYGPVAQAAREATHAPAMPGAVGRVESLTLPGEPFPWRLQGQFPQPGLHGEAAARAFLARQAGALGLPDPASLVLTSTRQGKSGPWLRFGQTRAGQPVFGREVVIGLDARAAGDAVRDATVHVLRGPLPDAPKAALPAEQALARARTFLGHPRERLTPEVRLGIDAATARWALRVRLATAAPAHDWELWLDPATGATYRQQDQLVRLTGTGQVYDPNPVVELNDTSLRDNNDQRSPTLDAARKGVDLRRLTSPSVLLGQWVDAQGPQGQPRATSATRTFEYYRDDPGFEQVMAYYHLDRVQEHIEGALGFADVDNRVQVVYADGQSDDNSHYSPFDKAITYGAGGVDDAEDADILVHEYGHSVQDDQVPGYGGGDEGAMGEGFGDYLSGSMIASLAPGGDPACIGEWDSTFYSGTNPPCLRRLDSTKHYPEAADGEVHDDGELWSASLWEARGRWGAGVADTLVLETHFALSNSETFAQVAAQVELTDQTLYAGAHRAELRRIFVAHGLSRALATPPSAPFVAGSLPLHVGPALQAGAYRPNTDEVATVTYPGATAIRLHFSAVDTETHPSCFDSGCDNLYVTDAQGDLYAVLNGQQSDVTTVDLAGDTAHVRLVSDNRNQRAGYLLDRVDSMSATPPPDAGPADAGPVDAGPADAGPADAGVDAGPALDAGADAGPVDAGPADAGPVDAGPVDAGPRIDAGPVDAGRPDAGQTVDAGAPVDAGPNGVEGGGGGCGCHTTPGVDGGLGLWLLGLFGLRRRR